MASVHNTIGTLKVNMTTRRSYLILSLEGSPRFPAVWGRRPAVCGPRYPAGSAVCGPRYPAHPRSAVRGTPQIRGLRSAVPRRSAVCGTPQIRGLRSTGPRAREGLGMGRHGKDLARHGTETPWHGTARKNLGTAS